MLVLQEAWRPARRPVLPRRDCRAHGRGGARDGVHVGPQPGPAAPPAAPAPGPAGTCGLAVLSRLPVCERARDRPAPRAGRRHRAAPQPAGDGLGRRVTRSASPRCTRRTGSGGRSPRSAASTGRSLATAATRARSSATSTCGGRRSGSSCPSRRPGGARTHVARGAARTARSTTSGSTTGSRPSTAGIGPATGSDHRPIWARLRVRELVAGAPNDAGPAVGRRGSVEVEKPGRHRGFDGARGTRRGRPGEGRAGVDRDDPRARPRPGRGARAGAGVRRVPHRPALPRGRDQRRLPVPARPRGGRGSSRRSATTSPSVAPGDFVDPQLAGGVRRVPGVPARQALVLLRHLQRDAEDDAADGTELSPALGIGAFAEKTLVAAGQAPRSTRRRSPRPPGLLGCGVMAGLGAAMLTGERARGDTRRGVRLRRRRRRGDRRRASSPAPRTIIAVDLDDEKLEWAKEFGATHTVERAARTTRSRRSGSSPTATAPTCASRRSAAPRCCSRRSSPATSPAPSCRSACPTRR